MQNVSIVHEIRLFNREYTNLIGLMDKYLLDSGFTLHELRILYEIQGKKKCTSKGLKDTLDIDGGYLSRILKKLEKAQLIQRQTAQEDLRAHYLELTEKGRHEVQHQISVSNRHIHALIGHLSYEDQVKLVQNMKEILRAMTSSSHERLQEEGITIRKSLHTGDLGSLTYLHATMYKDECGYDLEFEGYVCQTFADFAKRYNPASDRFFIAEREGHIVGCIAILGLSSTEAQLRWFLILPEYRGRGLGKKLLQMAANYCQDKKFEKVWLLTTSDQVKAAAMYRRVGFQLVEETPVEMWGRKIVEEKYEWHCG